MVLAGTRGHLRFLEGKICTAARLSAKWVHFRDQAGHLFLPWEDTWWPGAFPKGFQGGEPGVLPRALFPDGSLFFLSFVRSALHPAGLIVSRGLPV